MTDYLNELNEQQKNAVTAGTGPILVIAGAGSGKTKVLTDRIAWIMQNMGAEPHEIMALTFTNKAAREMESRLSNLLDDSFNGLWVGTFHRICLRILRMEGDAIGLRPDFVIYDEADQKSLIKSILKQNKDEDTDYRTVLRVISDCKNKMLTPDDFEENAFTDEEITIARIFKQYEEQKASNNGLDFDDILLYAVDLFTVDYDVLTRYRQRFRWVLVDEYQDTNEAQYRFLKLINGETGNLFVVGDPDQSIYAFRGGNIENILNFRRDFPSADVFRLERNYRSTKQILSVANRLIQNNMGRFEKNLFTDREGENVGAVLVSDEREEALFVTEEAKKLVRQEKYAYKDMAVFYRTHAQSRALEEKLRMLGVPYKIYGGLRFYDRKEIKDTLAYLQVLLNPDDNVNLLRIINEPRRGIGNTTIEKLQQAANAKGVSLWHIISSELDETGLNKGTQTKLNKFAELIFALMKYKDIEVTRLTHIVWEQSGYRDALEKGDSRENMSRLENMEEFLSVTKDFDKSYTMGEITGESGDNQEETRLWSFLSGTSLGSDLDDMDESEDYLTLMTIHMAKGLEFPVVFLVGMEETVFPHIRSVLTGDEREIEEERRLCYVGVTRAKDILKIVRAYRRTLWGRTAYNEASRFLEEMGIAPPPVLAGHSAGGGYHDDVPSRPFASPEKRLYEPDDVSAEGFSLGTRVRHNKFGEGVIVALDVASDKVKVAFPDIGIKEFLLSYARLEKL